MSTVLRHWTITQTGPIRQNIWEKSKLCGWILQLPVQTCSINIAEFKEAVWAFYPSCVKCWWGIKTVSYHSDSEDSTCRIIMGLNASNTWAICSLSVSHTSLRTGSAYTEADASATLPVQPHIGVCCYLCFSQLCLTIWGILASKDPV